MISPYSICCVQSIIRHVKDGASKAATIRENLHRNLSMIDYIFYRFGGTKLVVFPEFFLQGADHKSPLEVQIERSITIPGEETERLGEAAKEYGVFIAGAAFEHDPEWPGRYWNTAFIIDPKGEVILKYRKNHEASQIGILSDTTPTDVYSEYVKRYGGPESLFPVVNTEIGKLGCMICYDMMFPEVARCLAMQGAEVIIHPTGEPYGGPQGVLDALKTSMAMIAQAYFVSCNHGMYISPLDDDNFADSGFGAFSERTRREVAPMFRSRGQSRVIDYEGRLIANIDGPGEAIAQATVDVEALRRFRLTAGVGGLAHLKARAIGAIYSNFDGWPHDCYLETPMQDKTEGAALTRQVIEKLRRRGVYSPGSLSAGAETRVRV